MTLRAIAPAKLNLFLHVTGKRDDGYHLLDSVAVFCAFGDAISVEPADELSLTIDGQWLDELGADDDNLVIRAAKALQRDAGISAGAAIHLSKHIPIGAGLGGGSSDAATAALMLNTLWEVNYSDAQLMALLSPFGADIAACIAQRPVRMQGIGEQLSQLSYSGPCYVLLVNPNQAVLTQEVYQRYAGAYRAPLTGFNASELREYGNDLTDAALSICPAIAELLDALERLGDAQLVRMCGSGATCFALFDSQAQCQKAAERISAQHPNWWVQHTAILASPE